MDDGTLARFSRAVRDVLMNSQDMYLFRHLQALMFAAFVDSEETLYHRIEDAGQNIRK
jgi:hypothetical protein